MDITIKITDQDNIVFERNVTLTDKFLYSTPAAFILQSIFTEASQVAENYMNSKYSSTIFEQSYLEIQQNEEQ